MINYELNSTITNAHLINPMQCTADDGASLFT